MPKRWLFLVFGAGAPVCISLASIVPILVCILPLVLVLWESAPLALVLHIGPVLITDVTNGIRFTPELDVLAPFCI